MLLCRFVYYRPNPNPSPSPNPSPNPSPRFRMRRLTMSGTRPRFRRMASVYPLRQASGHGVGGFSGLARCGWSVSCRASIATQSAIFRLRVSARWAALTR